MQFSKVANIHTLLQKNITSIWYGQIFSHKPICKCINIHIYFYFFLISIIIAFSSTQKSHNKVNRNFHCNLLARHTFPKRRYEYYAIKSK